MKYLKKWIETNFHLTEKAVGSYYYAMNNHRLTGTQLST